MGQCFGESYGVYVCLRSKGEVDGGSNLSLCFASGNGRRKNYLGEIYIWGEIIADV